MRILATFLLLALTASAQTNAWNNPTPQMLAMSNGVAFMSTAPMIYFSWTWPQDIHFLYGTDPTYPTNVNAVIQENDDLTTPNWKTVWANIGTNGWAFATNQMGFFRIDAAYVNQ